MTRRPLPLAILVAAVLVVTGLSFAGTAEAVASKKPVRPKVGQCRTTTFAQAFYDSDPRKPVPCSQVHRTKTFAVATVPKSINLGRIHKTAANQKRWDTYVSNVCYPKYRMALGGSYAARAQVSYTWYSFIPTKAERRKGARWVRCDLALLATQPGGNSYAPPLPNLAFPFVGTRPITDTTRRCLSDEVNHYWTPCAKPHAARADQTFVFQGGGTAYPSQSAIDAQAATACPGKRAYAQGSWEWSHGNRTITCYTKTTS